MPVPCFLIAHPRGTLMWDVGVIPDARRRGAAAAARRRTSIPPSPRVVTRTLKSQLAPGRLRPAEGDLRGDLARAHRSHREPQCVCRIDVADAAGRARLHVDEGQSARQPDLLHRAPNAARSSFLDKDEHDVFGDGTVIIKAAPGHTPGHQVLVLRLASTGRIMLSGDLYHYPQERTLQSRAARQRVQRRAVGRVTTPHRGVSEDDEDRSSGSSTTSTRSRS